MRVWVIEFERCEKPIEPSEPKIACYCTECKQEVYFGEETYEDGLGNSLCPDCFESLVRRRMRDNLLGLAMELGYRVVEHK